jgi:hypothetical protein
VFFHSQPDSFDDPHRYLVNELAGAWAAVLGALRVRVAPLLEYDPQAGTLRASIMPGQDVSAMPARSNDLSLASLGVNGLTLGSAGK